MKIKKRISMLTEKQNEKNKQQKQNEAQAELQKLFYKKQEHMKKSMDFLNKRKFQLAYLHITLEAKIAYKIAKILKEL